MTLNKRFFHSLLKMWHDSFTENIKSRKWPQLRKKIQVPDRIWTHNPLWSRRTFQPLSYDVLIMLSITTLQCFSIPQDEIFKVASELLILSGRIKRVYHSTMCNVQTCYTYYKIHLHSYTYMSVWAPCDKSVYIMDLKNLFWVNQQ